MPIETTKLYICDSCELTSANPYEYRIIEGRCRMGNQTLVRGYDFKPEVLCMDCFCQTFGIAEHGHFDVHSEDARYKHIDPAYQGADKDEDKE